MQTYDCIIIGAGAAGLMCAATAGKRGRSVAILDHANKVGKKILMSGGGRCNFTNYDVGPEHYLSDNPHFCKSALSRYNQWDFISLVSEYELAYHEKSQGQLFCDNKAKDILNILLAECDKANADIQTRCEILSVVTTQEAGHRYKLVTSMGNFACQSLVIATGGLSIPTMGATGFGYDIAKQFGLKLKARNASLVPFTFKGEALKLCQSLAGVSLPVRATSNQQEFAESLLFTHKGLSGPAALQISNYWHPGDTLEIDFLPNASIANVAQQWRQQGQKALPANLLGNFLPKRFIQQWVEFQGLTGLMQKELAQWRKDEIEQLASALHRWQVIPNGTEGYRTAEVTRGGVDTNGVSSKTFEAKKAPGLYFIGEVLDVTGRLGGYNFQWAWASGYCCGQHV
ncbi:NAD(P)/FAD-dependent oxidoreductase [Gilvimarinus sp. SDUM040013]|uniref:NAD(P)/FAD-dependent oxidoreductase n=1 Tax=Gilvimarinus gilvus TaxID=3058038 RepID=A0ABU4S196_9GAMM|nr:NAD(P)/FAD-dependent oxidoreductase [Gilvimarinus sp. SDUM040013]MDO3385346.1 NAD(P)/FAD-dependent oxidoreductase [Gilvimarinus sp. SDUM040013]MDX6850921.1 NAD(P)/FAD-dependent oxidoreductase [Gilvimarinus sp. SDUM040013]